MSPLPLGSWAGRAQPSAERRRRRACSSQPLGRQGGALPGEWRWLGPGQAKATPLTLLPSNPPPQPVATNVSRGAPAPFLLLSGCYWGNWPWPPNWEPLPHPNPLSFSHSLSPSELRPWRLTPMGQATWLSPQCPHTPVT